MLRKIIKIDELKCNGCGACVTACHEGAIKLIDGKAKLIRDDYCDGLGDCLPSCPVDAISFEMREAAAFDLQAVKVAREQNLPYGCPSSQARAIQIQDMQSIPSPSFSQLRQWPVQMKLAPINAPYFTNAHVLIAADCTAYAYSSFHQEFMKNKVTLIGCPKLDSEDYSVKLCAILKANNIKSVTVARMEVPCCRGIEHAVKAALQKSEKCIPWQVIVISTDGQMIEK